jgi:hypothetical protein
MTRKLTPTVWKTRYVKVVVAPHRIRRYPHKCTEISFTVAAAHAVDSVKTLMCWMGYGCHQYNIVSAEGTNIRRPSKAKT